MSSAPVHAAGAARRRGGAKGNTPGKHSLIDPRSGPAVLGAGPGSPEGGADRAVQRAAAYGFSGPVTALPHGAAIQALFGRHDVSGVQAHVGGPAAEASQALGAKAYASGNSVAFGAAPDLHTAAHEAAHVVQQRGGVHLKSGIGEAGDSFERHADAVADRVVAGQSAESLLDSVAPAARGTAAAAAPGTAGAPIHRVEIVGTTHNAYRPSQDAVHPDIVALYAEWLRNNRFERGAAYVRATPTAPRALDDGHHSYVASKRANVDIEIQNMGIKDVGPADDWSQVAYRRFLDFESFLRDNHLIHHARLAALLEGIEAGDFSTAAEALKDWEIQLLLSDDQRYQDVWDADGDDGTLRNFLNDLAGDAPGASDEASDADMHADETAAVAQTDDGEMSDADHASPQSPQVASGSGGTQQPPPIAYAAESYRGYFYLPNYGVGSNVHGYIEDAVIVRTGNTSGRYFEATVTAGRFPVQYQSFTQDRPFVSPIGQQVWLDS
ncbi:MAG TPA: DUF4157 domain-containing protein [Kofleriaceae bacterium]|nr:DUF4157 domain-containing protein [Kofleriaceae bacterium]